LALKIRKEKGVPSGKGGGDCATEKAKRKKGLPVQGSLGPQAKANVRVGKSMNKEGGTPTVWPAAP